MLASVPVGLVEVKLEAHLNPRLGTTALECAQRLHFGHEILRRLQSSDTARVADVADLIETAQLGKGQVCDLSRLDLAHAGADEFGFDVIYHDLNSISRDRALVAGLPERAQELGSVVALDAAIALDDGQCRGWEGFVGGEPLAARLANPPSPNRPAHDPRIKDPRRAIGTVRTAHGMSVLPPRPSEADAQTNGRRVPA